MESFHKQLKRLIQVQKLSFSFFLMTILRGGSGGGSFPLLNLLKIIEPDEIATSLFATAAIAGAIVFWSRGNIMFLPL